MAKVLTVEETLKRATGTEQKSGQSELLQIRKNIREKVVRVSATHIAPEMGLHEEKEEGKRRRRKGRRVTGGVEEEKEEEKRKRRRRKRTEKGAGEEEITPETIELLKWTVSLKGYMRDI